MAYQQAVALLELVLQAGAAAYQSAAYDILRAYFYIGRILKRRGLAETALESLQQARQGFQVLADNGDQDAARMASIALAEQGDCLTDIGRLDEAVEVYQQAIKLAENQSDKRQVAFGKGQLATVRRLQKDYEAAFAAYAEARDIFSQLNDPQALAAIIPASRLV